MKIEFIKQLGYSEVRRAYLAGQHRKMFQIVGLENIDGHLIGKIHKQFTKFTPGGTWICTRTTVESSSIVYAAWQPRHQR